MSDVRSYVRHGKSRHPEYFTWVKMQQRCNDPSDKSFKHYGARGISVCDRWLCFDNFIQDIGARPVGMTLDRIDVNGNYEPSNCRWATRKMQANNKRPGALYEFRGARMGLKDLARMLGVSHQHLYAMKLKGTLQDYLHDSEKLHVAYVAAKPRHGIDDWPGFETI